MLIVRRQIRTSGITKCSHRHVFYVLQLQPIITDTLDSRICNNLLISRINPGFEGDPAAPAASTNGNVRFADDTYFNAHVLRRGISAGNILITYEGKGLLID